MDPWDIAERLLASTAQEAILGDIKPADPFWIGASYAVDPFVGRIYKLPLADPYRYERGLSAEMFDQVVKAILSGDLHGTRLVDAIEALSKACSRDQWTRWYRPILEGELDLRVPLPLFNKYAPAPIAPPPLNRPKYLTPETAGSHLPTARCFLQPAYEGRCFWLIDSKTARIEVRGYDENCLRLHDQQIEKALTEIGKTHPMDVVVFGYLGESFVVDDLLMREQYTRESSPFPLERRLEAANRLGLPLVQRSDMLTATQMTEFKKELGLIFEQKYRSALLRDLDGLYPFRTQCDWKLSAKSWSKQVKKQ